MDREFFEKLYSRRTKRIFVTKQGKKKSTKKKERFGTARFSFEESMIEDILYQFFLLFYTMIKDLPEADMESIIKFINFPQDTKIEVTGKLTEDRILAEAEIALGMAMDYFTEYFDRAHSEFMQECLEETQIYALCALSKQGRFFKLSKDGREVFNHKVKIHSRFANDRMLIDKIAGGEIKWTEERARKAVKRLEELENLLSNCKSLFPEKANAEERAKKIVVELPALKSYEEKIKMMLTKGSKCSVRDTATEILKEELNELPYFNLKSADYLKRRIADIKKVLERKAA